MDTFKHNKYLPWFKFYTSDGKEIIVNPPQPQGLFQSEFDLYNTITAFFELERKLINENQNIIKLVISITKETHQRIHLERIQEILEDLSLFIFNKIITFNFVPSASYQTKIAENNEDYDTICLFSGGADSFAGLMDANEKYNRVLALHIRHLSSSRVTNIVNIIENKLIDNRNIVFEDILVTKQIKKGYSQSRGLLYLICGGIYASRYNSRKLILSECGVTMYQPPFGELDRTTYTSDQFIQKMSKELIDLFLGGEIKIITPFENNTKSEMFTMSQHKDLLKLTHSCISSRFGKNLGCCYGCIIRRIGFIVSGVDDGNYEYDIFSIDDKDKLSRYGKNVRGEHKVAEFLELVKFSLDILRNYDSMDYSKKKKIETYEKHDLFRRFALDTFAALYLIIEKKNTEVNQSIRNSYFDAKKYIDDKELVDRINEVRNLA